MQEILFGYKLNPITWAYISSLMMVGIYFKFHRFWSVRNLDLVALIGFSPALLLIYYGLNIDQPRPDLLRTGYVWLFSIGGIYLVRLLLDPIMVRRPLLDPNLSASGLAFTGISLLVFLMANVITCPKERLEYQLAIQPKAQSPASPDVGYPPFERFSNFSNEAMIPVASTQPDALHRAMIHATASHVVAILAHLAIVSGMVWIGFRHFDNIHTGVAAATLYLLTFYTSQLTSQVDHVVPAMLLVWAVAAYRRPMIAGILIGMSAGIIFYPLFLLPLWFGFYWRRGLVRFIFGAALALALMTASLALFSQDLESFTGQIRLMFGWRNPIHVNLTGFWQCYESISAYRIPVLALFGAICCYLAIWPAQKNLGTLLSCTAAVMLATQFWHAHLGGLYMAWYLPLLILTVYRPNLEDRVALTAVQPLWRRKG